MQFFRYYPTTPYNFIDVNGRPFTLTTTNITAHLKVVERLRQNITVFYDYAVQDGDRPDTVAQKVYGSVNYTWIVLLLNNIFTLFDWPLTAEEFNNYIVERYGSVAAAQATRIYLTPNGYRTDAMTWAGLVGGTTTTAYDDEIVKNDAKRRIRIVPVAFVAPLLAELSAVFA